MVHLYNTINPFDLIATYRVHHPATAEYIFFSNRHGREHLPSLITFGTVKQTPIMSKGLKSYKVMLCDHNGIKLVSSNIKIRRKYPQPWKLSSALLNKSMGQEKVSGKYLKNILS